MQTTPLKKNLIVSEKTSRTYLIIFKEDGARVDITGWTVYFTVKEKMTDADDDASIKKTVTSHSDALQGESTVALSVADLTLTPGNYYYECAFKTDDNEESIICSGRFTVEKRLTQSTS